MDWLWGAWSAPAAPSLTKQTSESMLEFDSGKTGSLVLNTEDIRVMNVVSKLEATRRKLKVQSAQHEDELQLLQDRKQGKLLALSRKLEESMDETIYQGIVQNLYLQDGLEMASPGDGTEEAKIIMEIHKSEIQDKLRGMYQAQASDDMMEIYGVSPKIKERMSEREAKYLSAVVQADTLKSQYKELTEEYIKIQKRLLSIYHQAAKEHVEKKLARLDSSKRAGSSSLLNQSSDSELSAEPPVFNATKTLELRDVELEGVDNLEAKDEVARERSSNPNSNIESKALDAPKSPVSMGSGSNHSKSSHSRSNHSRNGLSAARAARARKAPSSSESAKSSYSAKSAKSSGRAVSAAAVRERRGKVGATGVSRGAAASTSSRVASVSGRTGAGSTPSRVASASGRTGTASASGRTGAASTASRNASGGRAGAASTPTRSTSAGGRTGAASRVGTAGRTTTAGRTGATTAARARAGAAGSATGGRGASAPARNVSAASVAARREARANAASSGTAGGSTTATTRRAAGRTASGRTGTASGRTGSRIARPTSGTAGGGTN